MSARDELLAIAEIAVSLIGFSGLIFVFRSRDITQLETRDLSAIAMIVGAGALALTFALLPLPLSYLGLEERVFWQLSSGIFAVAMLAAAATFATVNRRLVRSGHAERTPRLNRTTFYTAVTTAALLALSAIGVLPPGPAAYLFALVICILQCLAFVAFILVLARRDVGR